MFGSKSFAVFSTHQKIMVTQTGFAVPVTGTQSIRQLPLFLNKDNSLDQSLQAPQRVRTDGEEPLGPSDKELLPLETSDNY